jgi:hypothetical protein
MTTETAVRRVAATRYVTPLREGGSLPAIVEADDDGLYVLKFRGAGQGAKALIAELVAGEIGRLLGLPVPELVLMDLDPVLGRSEPDPEIRDLIIASAGLNLGLDYLPGALAFDPASSAPPSAALASAIAWFDAYVTNVDRTARNTNLLLWHRELWLIDHGAALYFHHDWSGPSERAASPFAAIRDHVLLRWATELREAQQRLVPLLTGEALRRIVGQVPDEWLEDGPFTTVAEHRAAYVQFLEARREAADVFTQEAIRAHERLV